MIRCGFWNKLLDQCDGVAQCAFVRPSGRGAGTSLPNLYFATLTATNERGGRGSRATRTLDEASHERTSECCPPAHHCRVRHRRHVAPRRRHRRRHNSSRGLDSSSLCSSVRRSAASMASKSSSVPSQC